MAKKPDYNCILYEVGDKVKEKYGSDEILEIEATDLRQVGIFPTLFLKFKGKPIDIGAFSNLYIPAGETEDKYKDGLKYYNPVTVKTQTTKTTKNNITFKRRVKEEIDLSDTETFQTVIVKRGTFTSGTAHKEKIE